MTKKLAITTVRLFDVFLGISENCVVVALSHEKHLFLN
jgi:hypothetical protein